MRQSIFFFLFLALAMTVMSAPAPAKKGRMCNPARLGKKTAAAPAVKGAPVKAAPAAKAAPAKVVPATKPGAPVKRLKKRAPSKGTTLCGVAIRSSSSSSGCLNKPGFVRDPTTGVSAWTPWEMFKSRVSILECDHALELQFTSKALDKAGFCLAWRGMLAAWTAYDPKLKDQHEAKMTAALQSKLKPVLNDARMLFYVDRALNGEKRDWTAKFLSSPVPSIATSDLSEKYFAADKRAIMDTVAVAIDNAASDLLSSVSSLATQGFDYDKLTDAQNTLECALITAETSFKSLSPVKKSWDSMKNMLGKP